MTDTVHDKDRRIPRAVGHVRSAKARMSGLSNLAIALTTISILTGTLTLHGTGLNYGESIEEANGWRLVSVFVIIVGLGLGEIASRYLTADGLTMRHMPMSAIAECVHD